MRISQRRSASALALAVLIALIGSAGCSSGGGEGSQGPALAEQVALRTDRVSAADLEVGEGRDICDQFPAPAGQSYDPGPGNPLAVIPMEHIQGPEDALVTIIEYADMKCRACAALAPELRALLERHPDDVRLVYRHVPANNFWDEMATQALEAASAQGAFWEMHDLLYARLSEWDSLSEEDLRAKLSAYAGELELDVEKFDADLDTSKYQAVAEVARQSASVMGLEGLPTIFVNDVQYDATGRTADELDMLVQLVLLHMQYPEAPPLVIDPEKDYSAWIMTEKGEIALDLFPEIAPQTVNNFAYLACIKYYDNVTFHRVLSGFVAQGGDPTGTGIGGPGYSILDEAPGVMSFDRAGLLSMARANQPDSARGQFFITLGPAEHLDPMGFTIFGEVVKGMDVLRQITLRDPQSDPFAPPGDLIYTIIVREES